MKHPTNRPTNHQRWEDLIPYYVNRTLAGPDRVAFEHHLAACPACRQALEEWHRVAGVVQRDVTDWVQHTPPLAHEVRAQVQTGPVPSANGHSQPRPALAPEILAPLRGGRESSASSRRRMHVPLTLVAAAMVLVVFGALLVYMATTDDDSSTASESESNNVLPTWAVKPTDTPLPMLSPSVAPIMGSPSFVQADDLGILGSDGSPAPTVTPSSLQALGPSGVGGAGGADGTVCQATPATSGSVAIYDKPVGGSIVGYMTSGEWMDVFQRTVEGWYQLIWPNGYLAGWVYGGEIALDGPCDTVFYPTATWTPAAITPTAVYHSGIGSGYMLVTTQQVGAIPPNTRVRISHAWFDGSGWWYYIVAENETDTAEAREWQITYAPGITPGPTPTAGFQGSIGMGYMLVTTEQVGAIPANTRVRISHAWFDGSGWLYFIVAEDESSTGEARERQLTYAPNVTPGPTPTSRFLSEGTAYNLIVIETVGAIPANTRVVITSAHFNGSTWIYWVMADSGATAEARESQLRLLPATPLPPSGGATPTAVWRYAIGTGVYDMITVEQVGAISPNTPVRIESAYFNGSDWVYAIVTRDGRRYEAYTYQITRDMNPPQATPTNVFQNLVGNGDYRFVTREQVGAIPPDTAVRIDAAWFDGVEWNYSVVDQAGRTATARLSQIRYPPPDYFATMTARPPSSLTPTIIPTFTPTPTSFDTQPPPARIRTFTADPDPVEAGATITLEWEVTNAATITIRAINRNGDLVEEYTNRPAAGTLDVSAPDNGDGRITYVLVVRDGMGREITGQITVTVHQSVP